MDNDERARKEDVSKFKAPWQVTALSWTCNILTTTTVTRQDASKPQTWMKQHTNNTEIRQVSFNSFFPRNIRIVSIKISWGCLYGRDSFSLHHLALLQLLFTKYYTLFSVTRSTACTRTSMTNITDVWTKKAPHHQWSLGKRQFHFIFDHISFFMFHL